MGYSRISDIQWKGDSILIETLGEAFDQKFIEKATSVSINPEVIKRQNDLKIVYTPIHGTGVKLVPQALAAAGFTNIIHIPEQDVVSGDFPTLLS